MVEFRPTLMRRCGAVLLIAASLQGLAAQEERKIEGAPCWVAPGEAEGDTEEAALEAAVAAARARLLAFRGTKISREVSQTWRAQIAQGGQKPDRGSFDETTESRLRETVSGELRASFVVTSRAERAGRGRFKATAEVACPERTLLPHRRLTTLHGDKAATLAAYLQLAQEYEVDEPALGEQTLQLAWARFAAPAAALALAQRAFRAERDGDALVYAELAAEKAAGESEGDASVRQAALDLVRTVRARVPRVEALVQDLLRTAEARRAPQLLSATLTMEPGRALIGWQVEDASTCRVLKTWIDHELTLHWSYRSDDAAKVTFSWPAATPSPSPSILVLWRLPADAPLWLDLDKVTNRTFARTGETTEADRLVLRELVRALIASPAQAAIVRLPER